MSTENCAISFPVSDRTETRWRIRLLERHQFLLAEDMHNNYQHQSLIRSRTRTAGFDVVANELTNPFMSRLLEMRQARADRTAEEDLLDEKDDNEDDTSEDDGTADQKDDTSDEPAV